MPIVLGKAWHCGNGKHSSHRNLKTRPGSRHFKFCACCCSQIKLFPASDTVKKTEALSEILKIPGSATCHKVGEVDRQKPNYPWLVSPVKKVRWLGKWNWIISLLPVLLSLPAVWKWHWRNNDGITYLPCLTLLLCCHFNAAIGQSYTVMTKTTFTPPTI